MTIIAVILLGFGIRISMLGTQSQTMTPELGVINNSLKECPKKPNCITSFYSNDKEHYYPAIKTELSLSEIKEKIANSELKWKLIKENQNYLYYTYESELIGFVDDIELLLIENKLHFRSASRVGYSDLGANKKRILTFEKTLR